MNVLAAYAVLLIVAAGQWNALISDTLELFFHSTCIVLVKRVTSPSAYIYICLPLNIYGEEFSVVYLKHTTLNKHAKAKPCRAANVADVTSQRPGPRGEGSCAPP